MMPLERSIKLIQQQDFWSTWQVYTTPKHQA